MNAWMWRSRAEFERVVSPEEVKPGEIGAATRTALFQRLEILLEHERKLQESCDGAQRGLRAGDHRHLKSNVLGLPIHGERLLLYNRAVACDSAAQKFLDYKHYGAQIYHEAAHLTEHLLMCAESLIDGARQVLVALARDREAHQSRFDRDDDLPIDARADFKTARDLFSVGEEEAGLILAGRGFEATIREVARIHGLKVSLMGKTLEELRALRTEAGVPLLTGKEPALLDLARAVRNSAVHANSEEPAPSLEAEMIYRAASAVWKRLGNCS